MQGVGYEGDPRGDPGGIQEGSRSFEGDPGFAGATNNNIWPGDPSRPLTPYIILRRGDEVMSQVLLLASGFAEFLNFTAPFF